MNARWYDSNTARFMTQATYQGTLDNPLTQNRYSYVLNNPVNMWDLRWFNDDTYDIYADYNIEHYVFLTGNDIVDVLSSNSPKIKISSI